MAELSCLADLTWIGGAWRTGAPDGTAFVPVLRAYLRLASESLRGFLDDGVVPLLLQEAQSSRVDIVVA